MLYDTFNNIQEKLIFCLKKSFFLYNFFNSSPNKEAEGKC